MKIARYKARTMQDALQRVRGDLGSDAIIISTRTLPPRLRWLGRERVEVVAAAGPVSSRRPGAADQGPGTRDQGPETTDCRQPVFPSPLHRAPDLAELQREIREVRDALGRMMAWTAPKDEAAEAIVARLADTGLSPELARELAGGVLGHPAQATWDEIRAAVVGRVMVMGTPDLLAARAGSTFGAGLLTAPDPASAFGAGLPTAPDRGSASAFGAGLPTAPDCGSASAFGAGLPTAPDRGSVRRPATTGGAPGPLVVALVGPTGVGKTTTIAKLAARHALAARRRVALVTLDTYRVAAVDQIRTYAQMLDVPLEVVVSPEDARPALERQHDKDLILVDTIGHGPNDEAQIGQLRMLLASLAPHQVHLALSAPTDRRTMLNALDRFSRLEPTHLLFTKLDEAVVFGAMVETAIRSSRPVSYFSYGQDVPEKIAPATPEQLAAAVCPEES